MPELRRSHGHAFCTMLLHFWLNNRTQHFSDFPLFFFFSSFSSFSPDFLNEDVFQPGPATVRVSVTITPLFQLEFIRRSFSRQPRVAATVALHTALGSTTHYDVVQCTTQTTVHRACRKEGQKVPNLVLPDPTLP